jgi:hypothetical protein
MNATDVNGRLQPIEKCYIMIGNEKITFDNLPDLGDSKGASYDNTTAIGRASPIPAYSSSDARSISLSINLFVQDQSDCKKNLRKLRIIQSALYPRNGPVAPFFPPSLCKIKCGSLLSENELCCIVKDVNAKFPTDVPWDEETLCPYRLEISMTLEVVYASLDLPNNEKILKDIPI